MSRRQELCHLPRAKLASSCPKVGIFVPVLVLSRPQLSTKQRRSYSTALVDVDSFFQESPGSVNDLRPCLHCDLLLGAGNGVSHGANESRSLPAPLSIDLHSPFAMYNIVV